MAVATVVAQALEELGVTNLRLKWPNDVFVADKKVAGILLELSQHRANQGGRVKHRVVVGIGLNVVPVSDDVGQAVTSLQDCLGSAVPPLSSLAVRIWSALRQCRDEFDRSGFRGFQRAWDARDALCGKPITVSQGQTVWHGIAQGVGADGGLRVLSDGEVRRVNAGEVSVRRTD